MSTAFIVHARKAAGAGATQKYRTNASTQYNVGGFVKLVNGEIAKCAAQNDQPTHLFICIETPASLPQQATRDLSTAAQEFCLVTPVENLTFRKDLVGNSAPLINGTACNANTDVNTVKVTNAAADNAFDGGTCFIPELGEQRLITDSQETAGENTLTVEPAFSRAPTTGDTVIAVPFSAGFTAVKLHGTTYDTDLSTAAADDSGGHLKIEEVHLEAQVPFVVVSIS